MQLKFNRTDKTILIFALTIMCVFSYFLYDDSFLFQGRESKNAKIGSIRQAENDVRLRASDSFTWNAAKKAEVVFERDSVFTGKRSQTQIDLIDGSKIFLSENSLVTLVAKNGSLELNLRYGNIQTEVTSSSKLELKAGSQKIQINKSKGPGSSKIEIKKPKYGLTKIKLLTGKVSIKQSATSITEELVKEQPVVIKPTGAVQKTPPGVITLITPDQSAFTFGSLGKGFYLDWHSQGTEKNVMTISKDKDFKSVVKTENDIKSKVFVKDLPLGTYFWKVSGQEGSGNIIHTEVRTFSVQALERLTIIEPADAKKFEAEVKADLVATHKEPVKISWTNIYDVVQIQIANEAGFQKPFYDKELTKSYSIDLTAGQGQYFIRVRGKKQTQISEWSDVRTFEVNIKARELVKPNVPVLITKKLTFNTSQSRSPSSINPITVKWQPTESALKYEVEISEKDPKFTKAMKLPTATTQINFVPKTLGTHYFRVRAISSDNLPSEFSETGELQTKVDPPKLSEIKSVSMKSNDPDSIAPPAQLKLSWSPVYLASKYLIEVAETKEFLNPEVLPTETNSLNYEVKKTGDFYFRVIASDSSQTIKSQPSNVEKSTYSYIKRLSKPVLIEPKNRMTVFLQKEIEPFIWLNWESTGEGKNFELEIGLDKAFTKIITRQQLNENKFLIKTKLPLTKIYWRVRQLHEDRDRISDWTESREFQLIHNKNEGVFK
jgi:hypothetical protein